MHPFLCPSLFLLYLSEDVPVVEFMYLVFTRMPGESYRPLVEFMCLVFTRMPGESYCPLVAVTVL